MPRNIEIKARLSEEQFKDVEERAKKFSEKGYPQQLKQEDTFFQCNKGRLKLRVTRF